MAPIPNVKIIYFIRKRLKIGHNMAFATVNAIIINNTLYKGPTVKSALIWSTSIIAIMFARTSKSVVITVFNEEIMAFLYLILSLFFFYFHSSRL